MKKIVTITLFFILVCLSGKSQSIYKTWFSAENNNLCINFKNKGYSSIDAMEFIKIKIKGNKLKIIDYYRPNALIGGKQVYWFNIEKLTETELILTQNPSENLFDTMPKARIMLISKDKPCN